MTKKELNELRAAVADYMRSEGCSCCRSDNHADNRNRLAKLLKVPLRKDVMDPGDHWPDFSKYETKR